MDWKDIGKKLLGIGAPILGTALGGFPGGLAAKAAVSAISGKFGIHKDEEKITAINTLLANPENEIRFRELELEEKVELQRLINEETAMYLADVQSARGRETRIVEATKEKDYFMYGLASLIVIGFFTLTGLLMFHVIPSGSNEVVFLLFGGLIAGFERVCSYFFGSSKSSRDKTNLLVNNAK